ncbi:MAG: TolB family protein [Solirubrobacterales bacterium]
MLLVVCGLCVSGAGTAMAEVPAGPRLAISVFSYGSGEEGGSQEVITTGPSGEDPQTLFGGRGASVGEALSWSATGARLAFSVSGVKSTASGPYGEGWPVVAVTRTDRGRAKVYPTAFLNAGDPVMAPDGRSVVFQRLRLVKELPGRENLLLKSAIWSLDVETGSVRRLTNWRLGSFLEPNSYSPDGSVLAAELRDRRGLRAVAIDLRGRHFSPIAREASEPTYSNGGGLAFVRLKDRTPNSLPSHPVSELWVSDADGSGAQRLLRKKGYISFPSWDPSGSRLSFTVNPPAEATGDIEPEAGNEVMQINADGTCLAGVFSDPDLTAYESAWVPGPGREAGPIAC